MRYSDADLRRLAASGAPLHQRWQGGIEPLSGDSDPSVQLQRWLHALSFEGEAEILVRRLAFDQLDIESCLPLLGSVRLADHEPLPAWVEWLDVVLLRYRSPQGVQPASTPLRANDACPSDTDGLLAHQDAWAYSIADQAVESIPFWEVWVPFVTQATEELRSRGNYLLNNLAKDALLTKDALQDFQLHLLTNLAKVAALPLSLEYRRFLARQDPLSILRTPTLSSPPSVDLYKQYIRSLQRGGLPTLLQEYPTLARLTAGITGHWTDHVAEFCERLREDKAALADLFNRDSDLGPVIRVRLGLSDPHHGRREVVIPTFARGLTVVYKPKDLGIDQAIWGFIDWFNTEARGDEHLRLRTLKVLNRTTHGWVEFIEHEACRDSHEARRYYQRTGMLLCVAYVLGGTDFHQENIIANGEHPVLLDLETMLQPSLRRWSGFSTDSADNRALEIMQRSVLCTGLLPFWIVGNADKSYDVSGIGSEPSDTGYLNAELENINTDRMQVVQRSLKTEPQANRPTLNGALLSAEHYLTDLIGGFATMYRILLAHRDVLLSEDGLMSRFSGLRLRYLMRMTKAYGQLLNRRLHPEFLREGTDSGIELERLARDFLVIHPDDDYPPPWGIYRAEVDALERLDIPFFSFFSDSNALISEGRIVAPGIFSETGLQRAFTCLNRLTEEDLQSQTDFIRASLHTRYNRHRSEVVQPPADDCTIEDIIQPPLSRVEFIAAAAAIAGQIGRAAIRGEDGSVTWLSLAFNPAVDRISLLPMSDDLYEGRIGVAFFLAALDHVADRADARDLSLAALLPLRKTLRRPEALKLTDRPTLGGAIGLGSQLYALVRAARWLNDDELVHLAVCAADRCTPKRIADDVALDIFGGAAGGILGLLALSEADVQGKALELAIQFGHHLLERRIRTETGYYAWPGRYQSRPLTGFGHGAAGVAYALLRLSQWSGDQRFRAAAEESIAYETAVYSEGARNWPDFREGVGPEGDRFMVAWCSGAAGIGLGRLGGLPVLDTPSVRRDIANALETTRATSLTDDDHLCCGNLGRLDLLAEASRRLARPELLDEARRRSSVLVRRAARTGHYGLFAQVPGVTDSYSLFQGTAGIGYELLRLADPEQMPCVLLWE